ncbi:KdsC family phosphatase [Desulfovibrio ferrophilus]|uniref:3-deoxy-D-manno-octulosonate 8-phosphatephosphatase n=1 Tax=Desulfovibrio ferrophilus TaxID=241368 RepID=A0A2Z6AWE6_9BACT|nr:HAD hydrolase family protein [Desulfovibrio ferrophilus]BBD07569.1 3-deoxy-D-manno-octulosonate 8-phosphatephosphatase [Desulfovibrio ferrophilus]
MNVKDKEQAAKIRLLVLDVDGVLTDGGLYYDHQGNISKRFNVQDGLGIKLAQAAGLEVAVITGLDSPAVETRVRELGITEYHAGHLAKIPLLEGICERLKLDLSEVAYLGDDWVDAGPMRAVGLPMAVANAQSEILVMADFITEAHGGQGAVREAIRHILEARGDLDALWEEWGNR